MTAVCYRFDSLWVGARKLNWMEVSCKTTEKPKFPYNHGRWHSPFLTVSSYPHCIEYPIHQERVGKSQNLYLPLPATLFRFYATSWLSSKSWTDRGTAVCGAQVVGKSLHMDGFSVSDLRFLMWGGSCKSGWNNCLSRFSSYLFLVTHLTDILRDAVTKGREYVLFYCILCLLFAGLLEGGGGSECSLFTCSVGFVLCSTPFEEQGGHVL